MLEASDAVPDGVIKAGDHESIKENAVSRPHDNATPRAESDSKLRTEVLMILVKTAREVLEIVAQASIEREMAADDPVILNRATVATEPARDSLQRFENAL